MRIHNTAACFVWYLEILLQSQRKSKDMTDLRFDSFLALRRTDTGKPVCVGDQYWKKTFQVN
jgi:hypothetical protein